MNAPLNKDGQGMDRRSFLKVSMLASGALMVGVGTYGTRHCWRRRR